jgi:uncharacterized protein
MSKSTDKKNIKINRVRMAVISGFSALLIINALLLAAGNHFYTVAINKNKDEKYLIDYYAQEVQAGNFDNSRYEVLKQENIKIRSAHGYELDGLYLENPRTTKDTVITVHGIGQDKWTMMKYADIYLNEGYNVFLYDSRNHGNSGGDKPSYGYFEKDDLETIVQYIRKRNPDGIIGIHGESMGGATAMMHASSYNKNSEVSFYVDDSGYSDLHKLFAIRLKEDFNLPNLLIVDYAGMIAKFRADFSFKQVSPVKDMDKITVPVMFIHGGKDTFVPTQMTMDKYNKKQGDKALYIAEDGEHANSILKNKALYRQELSNFLNNVVRKRS